MDAPLLDGRTEDHRIKPPTIIAGRPLSQRTELTIVDPMKFFEHIRTAAGQGFALDVEECERGLSCAAAPIFDRSGAVVAAVSVSGPSFRSGLDRLMREIVPLVSGLKEMGFRVSVSSLRFEDLRPELVDPLIESGERTLAVAPEVGSDRLRYAIHKRIPNSEILDKTIGELESLREGERAQHNLVTVRTDRRGSPPNVIVACCR